MTLTIWNKICQHQNCARQKCQRDK